MGDFALENPFSWDVVSVVIVTVLDGEKDFFLFSKGDS